MEFLPQEVISHIFSFLPSLDDRKACSLVCKMWYDAYQSPIFRMNELVEISSNEIFDQLCDLANPDRVYFHVLARRVDINKNTGKFWEKFGPHIKSLSIYSCDFREKSFSDVILKCEHLESLCIQDCKELLMSGHLMDTESDRTLLRKSLHGLKSLNLGYNRYLSDAIFVRFVSTCENLEQLLVPGCYISFHSGLYRKFYKNGHADPSESVFTFPVIFDFIRDSAEKLKLLSFSDTLIDSDAVSSIAQTKNLSLRELNLRGCLQVTNDCIVTLSDYQLSLTHLDLSLCPRITDLALLTICSRLTKLKNLSIQGCRAVTNLGISKLWKLTELTRLNISECESIHDEGIQKGLCRMENTNLEDLNLSHLGDITDGLIVELTEFIPNVRNLDLGYCYSGVTDRSVQAIFANAKHLRNLTLTFCERLTDRGLTGLALAPIANPASGNRHYRIPLGSKEELMIIRDAKLKRDVEEIRDSIGLVTDLTGSSLKNLIHLNSLNLSGCTRISDLSLKHAFKLNDLRFLDLSCCQQITGDGVCHICENNRSIESLNLDNCHNVSDTKVFHQLKYLKRLKSLILGSHYITDGIADCFADGWENLKLLDVRNCSQLSAKAVSEIMVHQPRLNVMHITTKSNDFTFSNPPPVPPPLIQL